MMVALMILFAALYLALWWYVAFAYRRAKARRERAIRRSVDFQWRLLEQQRADLEPFLRAGAKAQAALKREGRT